MPAAYHTWRVIDYLSIPTHLYMVLMRCCWRPRCTLRTRKCISALGTASCTRSIAQVSWEHFNKPHNFNVCEVITDGDELEISSE